MPDPLIEAIKGFANSSRPQLNPKQCRDELMAALVKAHNISDQFELMRAVTTVVELIQKYQLACIEKEKLYHREHEVAQDVIEALLTSRHKFLHATKDKANG